MGSLRDLSVNPNAGIQHVRVEATAIDAANFTTFAPAQSEACRDITEEELGRWLGDGGAVRPED